MGGKAERALVSGIELREEIFGQPGTGEELRSKAQKASLAPFLVD